MRLYFFIDRHDPAQSGTIRLFSVPPKLRVALFASLRSALFSNINQS